MVGLTDKGFSIKRLDQLIEELTNEFKNVFGDNFNTEPQSPQGQIIGVVSESNSNLYELAEEAYNSFNPDVASDITLDNLVALNGIQRLSATTSKVDLVFSGSDGARIPKDTIISDGGTVQFVTTDFGIIVGNTITIPAECNKTGDIVALANTLTNIENPITNVDSVNNPTDAILGADAETDAELRARRVKSLALGGLNSTSSIYSAVANVERVESVSISENDTQVDGFNGLPRNSFKCVVYGGVDENIALAIFSKKPVGITTVGNTTLQVKDSEGFESEINFQRPVTKALKIRIELEKNIEYSLTGDQDIKDALIEYTKANLNVNQDVIYSRLFTPINSVKNHSVNKLEIALDSDPLQVGNLTVDTEEIALLDEADIEIVTI